MTQYIIAHKEESQYFGERYEPVLEAVTHANDVCFDLIKEVQSKAENEADNVLWMLAASCLNEFEDIVLLSGNGRGVGATKLVRAFYERVVTCCYLAQNPHKMQQFIGYSDIHWHKLFIEATKFHSDADIPAAEVERVKTAFEASKGNYLREKCSKCKETEVNGSWTRLPPADMASQIDPAIRKLAFNAYLKPTFHIHTTHFGIVDQCDASGDKARFSNVEKQRKMAADALTYAHILLLQLMLTLNDKFKLGRDEELTGAGKQFEASWAKVEGRAEPPQHNVPQTPTRPPD